MKSKPILPIDGTAPDLTWAANPEPRLAYQPATPPSIPARGAEIGLWLDAYIDVDAWIDAYAVETD